MSHLSPPTRAMIRFGTFILLIVSIIIGACTDDAPVMPTGVPPSAVTSLPPANQTNVAAWWQAFFDPNAPAEYTAGLESWLCTSDKLSYWSEGEMNLTYCQDAVSQLSSSMGVFVIGVASPLPGDEAIGLGLVYKNAGTAIEVVYKVFAMSTAAYAGDYLGDIIGQTAADSIFSYTGAYTTYADDLYVGASIYKGTDHHNQASSEAQAIYAAFAAAFATHANGGPPPQCKTVVTEMVDGAIQYALVLMDSTIAPGFYPLYWWNGNTGTWSAYYKDAQKFNLTVEKYNSGKPISPGMNGKKRDIFDGCTNLPPGGFATP